MRSALRRPRVGFVALFVSCLLVTAPAAAQTPHGLKTHMRLVNSMSGQTSPGEWWGGDGWTTPSPLVTHGVNNVSNALEMYSNSDFTAIADYGLLRFYGNGSAQSVAPNGLFLWVDDWIGAEPRAQYRDRLYVTSATLPAGTPAIVQFQLTLSGSTTIVDTNPSASVAANLTATHTGPDVTLSLSATPGVTSGLLDTAVGDSIDVHGLLRVHLSLRGLHALAVPRRQWVDFLGVTLGEARPLALPNRPLQQTGSLVTLAAAVVGYMRRFCSAASAPIAPAAERANRYALGTNGGHSVSTMNDLERMKSEWVRFGIDRQFSKIHHFSSDRFASNPCGIRHFYNWCRSREIKEENAQTLKRALEVSRLVSIGIDFQSACTRAWKMYPIRMR